MRYAEFGRAISQRILRGETTPRVIYYGMFHSPEARNLQKLKEEFEVLCPNRAQAPGPVSVAVPPPRVAGAPDFNVDGGATPLDIDRVVDLEKVSVPDAADRRGFSNRMVFIFSCTWICHHQSI